MNNNNNSIWRPVILFYAKTTSWIIFPLILGVLLAKYISKSIGSQILFFIIIIFGFVITCFGIYKEVKIYKKGLEKDPPSHKATDGQEINGNK